MKLLTLLISFLLVVCVLKSVQTDDKSGIQDVQTVSISSTALNAKNNDIKYAVIAVDTVIVLVNVIQILVESEILKSLSGLLGPMSSALGITQRIMGLYSTEPDIEGLFAEQNKFLRQSFKDMSNQLERLSMQMQEGETRIIATVQYQGVLERISQIDGFLERIPILVSSFAHDNQRLLQQINEQLRIYGNLDDDLTNLVFVETPATTQQSTLLDTILSLCTPDSQSCSSFASINQMIYDFFEHIMISIGKGAYFQKKCYQMKEILEDKSYFDDITYVGFKRDVNMRKIMRSIKISMERFSDDRYLKSHLNLIRNPLAGQNFERLQRVTYYGIFAAGILEPRNSYGRSCPSFNERQVTYPNDVCSGSIQNCDRAGGRNDWVHQVFAFTDERVFRAYQLLGVWQGEDVSGVETRYARGYQVTRSRIGGPTSEICRCTCDAHADPLSHRSFYVGLIEAEKPGHIITGVRFVKRRGTMFIQIQTGELLPLGMVNAHSAQWQALPVFLRQDLVVSVGFQNGLLYLPDLKLPTKHVLTGVQFTRLLTNEITIRIEGKYFNFLPGVLMETKVQATGVPSGSTIEMFNRLPEIDPNFAIYNIFSNIRVNMGMSNERRDAGQNFLPYFDSHNITLTIPAPLSGLELFLYTSAGSPADFGGFVRPRLTTINYLDYLLTMSSSDSVYEFNGNPDYIFDSVRLHSVH